MVMVVEAMDGGGDGDNGDGDGDVGDGDEMLVMTAALRVLEGKLTVAVTVR